MLALICSGGGRPGELRSINTPEHRAKISPKVVAWMTPPEPDVQAAYCKAHNLAPAHVTSFAEALTDAARYKTVVLDHASGLADLILKEMLGLEDFLHAKYRVAGKGESWSVVTQQQYGQLAIECKEAFRKMLNLPNNVVIVAQQRTFGGKEDGAGAMSEIIKPTVGAALTPSVTGWLNPAVDFVVQMFKRPRMVANETMIGEEKVVTYSRGQGVDYCLRCEPHDVFTTKFRLPRGLVLPDVIIDPTYEKLAAVIRGEYKPVA
jgi:hypothetical protein